MLDYFLIDLGRTKNWTQAHNAIGNPALCLLPVLYYAWPNIGHCGDRGKASLLGGVGGNFIISDTPPTILARICNNSSVILMFFLESCCGRSGKDNFSVHIRR